MTIGTGNIFDLQGTITVDTSDLESDIKSAVESAEGLQSALSGIDDSISVDVDVDDGGSASDISDEIDDITDSVTVKVDVDDGESAQAVSDDIGDIGTQADTSQASISDLKDFIITGLAGAATIGAITTVAEGIKDLASGVAKSGDTIDKQSQVLGISRRAYQEWDYILSQNGTSIEATGTAFRKLTNNIADGSDTFKTALDAIGLSYDEISKMSTEDAFETIVTAMQNAGDFSGKEATAMDLFGNRATALMPLLNGTAESVTELKDAASDLGMIMSDEDIDSAVHYTDALDTLERTVNGIKNAFGADLLVPLTEAITAFTTLISTVTDESLTQGLENIKTTYLTTIADIQSSDAEATAIINAMEALENFDGLTEEQQEQWNAYKDRLLEIMPELGGVFEQQNGKIQGTADALRETKDNLIELAIQEASYNARKAQQEKLAEAAAELTDVTIQAQIAQGKADNIGTAIETNMRSIAASMGEDFNKWFMDSLEENTDENGVTNWANVYNELFTEGILSGFGATDDVIAKTKETMLLFGEQGDAMLEAATAQETLTKKTEEYNTKVAEVKEWDKIYWGMSRGFVKEMSGISDTVQDAADDMDVSDDASKNLGKVQKAAETVFTSFKTSAENFVTGVNETIGKLVKDVDANYSFRVTTSTDDGKPKKKAATGIDYVPTDDFPALLHQGEAVLTRGQADAWRNGGNNSGGLSESAMNALASKIAGAVANQKITVAVNDREICSALRSESTRQNGMRTNQVNNGYGNIRNNRR